MNFREAFDRALQGVEASQFYTGLVNEIGSFLSGLPEQAEIPSQVVQETTKWVENELRSLTENFLGHKLLGKAASGIGLLNAMQESGLVLDELARPEPILFLLRWYITERNVAHHDSPLYSWPTFLCLFWASNYILREAWERRSKPRAIHMDLQPNPATVFAGQLVTIKASLTTPTTGAPFVEGEFEARLVFSNSQVREVSLSFYAGELSWRADVSTSGAAPGTYLIVGEAAGPQGRYISKDPARGMIESRRVPQANPTASL